MRPDKKGRQVDIISMIADIKKGHKVFVEGSTDQLTEVLAHKLKNPNMRVAIFASNFWKGVYGTHCFSKNLPNDKQS